MADRPLSDAERRYLDAVATDRHRILGAGMDVVDLVLDDQGSPVSLTFRYRLDGYEGETIAHGETAVDAHAVLREALVLDRIRLGFAVMTDPRHLA
jgi:hypothetical protein